MYSIIAILQDDRAGSFTNAVRTIDTQDHAVQYCFDLMDLELGSDATYSVDDDAEEDSCLMYCGDCSDTASSVCSDAPGSCASQDSAELGMVANETFIHSFIGV